MYEALSVTQNTVVSAEVTGFVEKKFRFWTDYLFVVEVLWTDKRTSFIKRNYYDFFVFYRQIRKHFQDKCEKGIVKTPIYIPQITGPRVLQRATRDLAEKQEDELHYFLHQLFQGNPLIACNQIVIDFFQPRPTDPLSCRDPPDGSAEKPVDRQQDDGGGDDSDENADEILYTI